MTQPIRQRRRFSPARRWCAVLAFSALSHALPILARDEPPIASPPTSAPATQPTSAPVVRTVNVAAAVRTAREWLDRPRSRRVVSAYDHAFELIALAYDQPRPQRIWIARIDLTAPGLRIELTEPNPRKDAHGKSCETDCETTLDFARRKGVQVAVNTSAFGPLRAKHGEPMDVAGLAAVQGRVFSKPVKDYAALYFSRDNVAAILGPPLKESDVWNAIAGFKLLVDDRVVTLDPAYLGSDFGRANPRTAAGVDRDGKTAWFVVADGRQPGRAVGLTLAELAAVFQMIGAWDALNLDGGGSTALVVTDDSGNPWVVNTPIHAGVPGTLRQVANNLGFHLQGKGPSAEALAKDDEGPTPPTGASK